MRREASRRRGRCREGPAAGENRRAVGRHLFALAAGREHRRRCTPALLVLRARRGCAWGGEDAGDAHGEGAAGGGPPAAVEATGEESRRLLVRREGEDKAAGQTCHFALLSN